MLRGKDVYQSWFLEKVDDAYDSTYCDIYARMDTERGAVVRYNNAERKFSR